ncbi:IclR family transcriptional regulator domain-containing protein [Acrocarpospora catenulata]|uniref:IclR family transcriptional regulator domain-containing protein n=1 Tax=Acrocarpospora catenulata TaxID=2836182 RepID=UPI0027E0D6E3|nr:IclR family transcriptional regulator C-terminal domain-containing protein [Acrocarpospora catenulata]
MSTTRDASVGPLERGLAVLRAMAPTGPVRPSDLARHTGLARSTVDRVLATLIRLGYVRESDRTVRLTPRLLELGNAYLTGSGIPDALEPLTARLAAEFDESVSVAVPDGDPDGDGVRFVTQIIRRRTMSPVFRIGDLLPAERCAPGALFAAGWSETDWAGWRRSALNGGPVVVPRDPGGEAAFRHRAAESARGWAEDDQLIEPGLIAVAVPVTGQDGRPVCAVSVVSHTSRHSIGSLAELVVPRLRAEAPCWPPERPLEPVPVDPPVSDPALAAKNEIGAEFLQSLARGLAVLAALGGGAGGLTLTQVAEATGLPRATARRSLLTLVALGYAAQSGRRFAARPKVLGLGYGRLSSMTFEEIVAPHLADLAERIGESVSMAVLDGTQIRYVARVPAYRIMSVDITVGTRLPAYATSMGRVLLAGLPPAVQAELLTREPPRAFTPRSRTDLDVVLREVAADGFALVDEELEEGLRSLAVPVRDGAGRAVAAVNVATHAARGTPEGIRAALLPALADTAAGIEADLRGMRGPIF